MDCVFGPEETVSRILKYSDEDLTCLIQVKGLRYQNVKHLDRAMEEERALRNPLRPHGLQMINTEFAYSPNVELWLW